MISAKAYLKKYTLISPKFIDELYTMYDEESSNEDLVINLDSVERWLGTNKKHLHQLLKKRFKTDEDFVARKATNPNKTVARANNYTEILITPSCFKRICLLSESKNGERMRDYMIQIEATLLHYRNHLVEGLKRRVRALENNQRPPHARSDAKPEAGVIFVYRAGEEGEGLFRLASSSRRRPLASHNGSHADDVKLELMYETTDHRAVEACAKALLRGYEYRARGKAVYRAPLESIKGFLRSCITARKRYAAPQLKTADGKNGEYIVAIFARKKKPPAPSKRPAASPSKRPAASPSKRKKATTARRASSAPPRLGSKRK